MMKNKYIYMIIIFLIVSCIAAFGRIAENDFISYDDNLHITNNSIIQSGFTSKSIRWAFTTVHHNYWHSLAWLSHMLDWKLFGDDFNKSVSLNPRNPDGYYNRGLTYDVMGYFQTALADFNKAISLDSNYINSYNNRGIVYAKLNRFQEAIEDFYKNHLYET